MVQLAANSAYVYEPSLTDRENSPAPSAMDTSAGQALPQVILLKNIFWFCRLRWIVVAILIFYGIAGLLGDAVRSLGLRPPGLWPLGLAMILALGNLGFRIHAGKLEDKRDLGKAGSGSLWIQILFDLVVLTIVVYFLGGAQTFFSFACLFHIGLACIFFPRSWSFLVTVMACIFFSLSVILEAVGVLPGSSIYLEPIYHYPPSRAVITVNVISAQAIWVIVWYLVSRLSALVRARDLDLARANQRLMEAQEERTRHMLQTTHQLKAPFAAIHANTQLLLKGHCGILPDPALDVVLRIAGRTRRLAREIQDMLQLANLDAPSQKPCHPSKLELTGLLRRCIEQVQALAEEKNIHLKFVCPPTPVLVAGVEDHYKMMFDNLLANAVMYSRENGTVQLNCANAEGDWVKVELTDNGIGIPSDKLPKIFDEYYRTNEAVRHWKESTGLGLAIVKRVANSAGIRIKVTSEVAKGTRFELNIPRRLAGSSQ